MKLDESLKAMTATDLASATDQDRSWVAYAATLEELGPFRGTTYKKCSIRQWNEWEASAEGRAIYGLYCRGHIRVDLIKQKGSG